MAKQKDNYLDYVPKHNSLFECRENKKGHVEVKVHNKGIFNRIAQLIARKPRYSYIELDDFGTFVWHSIDGVRSIYDIGQLVKEHFGDKAEPLYERLCYFIKLLHKNQFIVYMNKINKQRFFPDKFNGFAYRLVNLFRDFSAPEYPARPKP